jgi:glycosyltransferase involved in cell wall biosynthesis
MKVLIANFFYDEDIPNEQRLLERYYSTTGWAEALQRKGIDVAVINRFYKESFLEVNNVKYYFVKDRFKGRLKPWQVSMKCLKKISQLNADVVHVHGISITFHIFLLRMLLRKKTAIVVQDHKSARGRRRFIYNFFNGAADGFFFATSDIGKEWLGIKGQFRKIFPVMEGGTIFNFETRDADRDYHYYDRNEARKLTNTSGSPVFLWVGRFHQHTDPLTVLDGIEILFQNFSTASFYMIHSGDQLFSEVKKKIEGSQILKQRVHLLGKVDRREIKMYYDSSDYFVAGSHYEGSVYALREALSCGCVPIVTNIPTFRMMTDEGKLGALWEPGNKNSFVQAAVVAINKPLREEANACIEFFKNHLSFDAITEVALNHYEEVVQSRSKK